MDAPGSSKPATQSDLPHAEDHKPADEPEEAKKTSHAGRTISREGQTSPRSIVAEARALAGPDKAKRQQVVSSRKTHAEIQKIGDELDASNQAIRDFIKTNKLLEESNIQYDPVTGFSGEAQRKSVLMSQLKDLIDQHTRLLNQIFNVISPSSHRLKMMSKAIRSAASKKRRSPEDKALLEAVTSIPGIDGNKAKYWKERGFIRSYSVFCMERFQAVCTINPSLQRVGDPEIYIARVEEFIAHSLEWMQVLVEVMQCDIAEGKNVELQENIKAFDNAAVAISAMIQDSEKFYVVYDKLHQLRHVLAENGRYLDHWLETLGDFSQKPHDSPKYLNAIVAAIVMDKPEVALNIMETFSQRVNSGDFPASDCFRVCLGLISSITWLYDRPEPLGEHKNRVRGAEKIVKEFGNLVRHVDENKLLSDESRASLLQLFAVIDDLCCSEVRNLEALEQRVLDRGAELVREEDAQKQKVQSKLEKRERRRQKRLAEQQATKKVTPSDEPINEPDRPSDDSEVQLHPSLKKALDAFSQNEPNRVIKSAFHEVVQDKSASAFDKAQAHYGYADVLSARLSPRLETLNAFVDATYDYEKELLADRLPPSDNEFRFNKVLSELKGQVEGINWAVLEMAQSIKSALDIFYELGDEKAEFLEQLLELHDQAEDLIAKTEKVTECCGRLPDIYQRRGRVLSRYLMARTERRANPEQVKKRVEKKKLIEDSIREIKDFSSKLDGSIRFIKSLLNRNKVESAVTNYQQQSDNVQVTADSATASAIATASTSATVPEIAEASAVPVNRKSDTVSSDQTQTSATPSSPSETTSFEQNQPAEPVASTSGGSPVEAVGEASGSTGVKTVGIESQPAPSFVFPVRRFMPEDLFSSLEKSIEDTGLSWQMGKSGLVVSDNADSVSGATARPEPDQPAKGRRKGKGKKRKVAASKPTEPKAELPAATGSLMQLRVRDYLKSVVTHGKSPDGKPLPDGFDLEGVKARIEAGTFLSTPDVLEDFAILADALRTPVRLIFRTANVFNCMPGLGKPVKVAMNEYPDTPHMSLEYFASEKNRRWFTSLPHLFEYVEEETARQLEKKKQ